MLLIQIRIANAKTVLRSIYNDDLHITFIISAITIILKL